MFFVLVLLMFRGSAWETGRVDLRAVGLTFKFKKRRQLFVRARQSTAELQATSGKARPKPSMN